MSQRCPNCTQPANHHVCLHPPCKKTFISHRGLTSHVSEYHATPVTVKAPPHSLTLQRDNNSPSGPLICPRCDKTFAKRQKAADHVKEAHFNKPKADDGPPTARTVSLYDPEPDDAPQASTSADVAPDGEDEDDVVLSFMPRDRRVPAVPHPGTPEGPVAPPPPPPPPQANPPSDDVLVAFGFLEPNLCCPVCSDVFVSAHVVHPCGHSFCGFCLWAWWNKVGQQGQCPLCRAKPPQELQYCKNFTLDDVVERFLDVVRAQGHPDWVEGAVRNGERNLKKRKWAKQWAIIKGEDPCDPTYDPAEDANP